MGGLCAFFTLWLSTPPHEINFETMNVVSIFRHVTASLPTMRLQKERAEKRSFYVTAWFRISGDKTWEQELVREGVVSKTR